MRWVIGDIHGMLKPLRELLGTVLGRDPHAQFFFVGDYVNRGPDSRGVVELLLGLHDARFIRGNHDDIFDLLLNGKSHASGADPIPVFAWFMAHGLDRTLISYGIDEAALAHVARRPTTARLIDLVEPVPQRHREFFRNLPLAIEHNDLFIVHAKWSTEEIDAPPDLCSQIAHSAKLKHRVLWERFSDRELWREKVWTRRGIFGHTPVINYSKSEESLPIVGNKTVLIDTGVALSTSGRLTAFCADTDEYVQVDHFGKLVDDAVTA